jgi:hypothetical protein
MKAIFAAALVVTTVAGFAGTADALTKPQGLPLFSTAVQPAKCVGNIRTYRDFAHCKSYARNSSKYCNKICS